MKRMQVSSSMISSVGYDPRSRILEVEFTSGDVGQYSNVPAEKYQEMVSANSIGSFLHREIKPNYPFTKGSK
jgi:hypothetical protein